MRLVIYFSGSGKHSVVSKHAEMYSRQIVVTKGITKNTLDKVKVLLE